MSVRATAPALPPIFRSRLQGDLLAFVLADPDRQWTVEELARRTGEPYQTVATEVRRLQQADLLDASTIGRTKLLSTNEANPYFKPLGQLATMAFGSPIVISEEFTPLDGIESIYIYGSWAARYSGESGPDPNDIDVLVIGQPDRDDVYDAARRAQQRLTREVNVTQRTRQQRNTARDGFSQQIRASPMVEVPYPQTS